MAPEGRKLRPDPTNGASRERGGRRAAPRAYDPRVETWAGRREIRKEERKKTREANRTARVDRSFLHILKDLTAKIPNMLVAGGAVAGVYVYSEQLSTQNLLTPKQHYEVNKSHEDLARKIEKIAQAFRDSTDGIVALSPSSGAQQVCLFNRDWVRNSRNELDTIILFMMKNKERRPEFVSTLRALHGFMRELKPKEIPQEFELFMGGASKSLDGAQQSTCNAIKMAFFDALGSAKISKGKQLVRAVLAEGAVLIAQDLRSGSMNQETLAVANALVAALMQANPRFEVEVSPKGNVVEQPRVESNDPADYPPRQLDPEKKFKLFRRKR